MTTWVTRVLDWSAGSVGVAATHSAVITDVRSWSDVVLFACVIVTVLAGASRTVCGIVSAVLRVKRQHDATARAVSRSADEAELRRLLVHEFNQRLSTMHNADVIALWSAATQRRSDFDEGAGSSIDSEPATPEGVKAIP